MSAPSASEGRFSVALDIFTGPFDLLLQLIAKHQLDITEVALAQVTDEFLAFAFADGADWDLSEASQFLVIAATLLDLKAMRLLPGADREIEEDFELLEARDLLFARLLQYRAFKEVANDFADRLELAGRCEPRSVVIEPEFVMLLPELIWSIGAGELAVIAQSVFSRDRSQPEVAVDHLHHPVVPVAQQAQIIIERLQKSGRLTFTELVLDASSPTMIVARFLALLELYRDTLVDFEQNTAGAELTVMFLGTAQSCAPTIAQYDADYLGAGGPERSFNGTD